MEADYSLSEPCKVPYVKHAPGLHPSKRKPLTERRKRIIYPSLPQRAGERKNLDESDANGYGFYATQ